MVAALKFLANNHLCVGCGGGGGVHADHAIFTLPCVKKIYNCLGKPKRIGPSLSWTHLVKMVSLGVSVVSSHGTHHDSLELWSKVCRRRGTQPTLGLVAQFGFANAQGIQHLVGHHWAPEASCGNAYVRREHGTLWTNPGPKSAIGFANAQGI